MKQSSLLTTLISISLISLSGGCASLTPSTYSSRTVDDQVVVDATGRAAENAALSNQSSVMMGNVGQQNPYSAQSYSDSYLDTYSMNSYEQIIQRSMSNILDNAVRSIEF